MHLRNIPTILLLGLLSGCALFVRWPEITPPERVTPRAQLAEADRVRQWREDTEALRALLLAKHPDPFFRGTQAAFEAERARILEELPRLEDRQIVLRWMAWVRLLGDEHTFVEAPWVMFDERPRQPFLLGAFEGIPRVIALAPHLGPGQEDLFGCELLAVEGVLLERLVALSFPNRAAALPACRQQFELLGWPFPGAALDQGLLPDTPVWTYTFRGLDGREFQRRLPRARAHEGNWRGPAAPKGTLRRRHPEKVAFLEWLPERHAAYIRYRRCESHSPSLMALLKEVDRERESRGVTRLVVDLRGNGGGNSLYHWRFQRALARHPVFGKPGHLSVLTDVGTFSSGFLLAWDLKHDAQARIVGETSGQPANAYGDIRFHNLPNFKSVSVGISLKGFFRAGGDPVDFNRFLVPDLSAPMNAQAWMRGEDPTLEAALAGN